MFDDEPVLRCACCGNDIFAGDSIFEVDRRPYCEDCVYRMTAQDYIAMYVPFGA